ncbi:unnamed protein product [Rhizoctonia solani]|uniref:Peptidase C14 caspase domain-containing protein n=1 Tax=Rhizoctonia solani TaxID=456999 RepID=A0A8H3DIQ6_9AGAM|nr:unnamed protein product [Rhizoctonia solani]
MEEYSFSSDRGVEPIVEGGGTRAPASDPKPSKLIGCLKAEQAEEMVAAIEAGDYSAADPDAKVERRALLVAVQYLTWPRDMGWRYLGSTPSDVWLIYEMLRGQGYEPSDIRILVEGIMEEDRYSPTRSNILAGLEWLVAGARTGDYRYFHFSGHGDAFETNEDTGKIAKKIPETPPDRTKARKDDIEHLAPDADQSIKRNERHSSQTIVDNEIRYYNEAFMTVYKMPPHTMRNSVKRQNYNRVRDDELNAMFSKLPQGSTITTSLDCCHSGRMINNNLKLRGSGFRGNLMGSEEQNEVQESLADRIRDPDSTDVTMEDGKILRNGSVDIRTVAVTVLPPQGSEGSPESEGSNLPNDQRGRESFEHPASGSMLEGYFEPYAPLRNYILPPLIGSIKPVKPIRIKMAERLPAVEASRDNIKATIMAWSGCQQRQSSMCSWEGWFTDAFTSAISDLKGKETPTIRMVHRETNTRLKKRIRTFIKEDRAQRRQERQPAISYSLQYTQLWTSLGDGDEEVATARARLDCPFVV